MKKNIFLIILSSCSIFLACNYSDAYVDINSNNLFQISIPGWVKKETLAEDALISYANRYRNFYLIVLANDKKISFDSAKINAFRRIYSMLDSASFTSEQIQIGALPTTHYSIEGKMGKEAEKLIYELYILEGKNKYYQICIWTRSLERRKKYGDDFYKIVHSFKEI